MKFWTFACCGAVAAVAPQWSIRRTLNRRRGISGPEGMTETPSGVLFNTASREIPEQNGSVQCKNQQ